MMFRITVVYHCHYFCKNHHKTKIMTWVVFKIPSISIGIYWTESLAFIDEFCTAGLEYVFTHYIPAMSCMIAKVEKLTKAYGLWRHLLDISYCQTLNWHCQPEQMSSTTSIQCHWGSGIELRWQHCTVIEKWLVNGLWLISSNIHIHSTIHVLDHDLLL